MIKMLTYKNGMRNEHKETGNKYRTRHSACRKLHQDVFPDWHRAVRAHTAACGLGAGGMQACSSSWRAGRKEMVNNGPQGRLCMALPQTTTTVMPREQENVREENPREEE